MYFSQNLLRIMAENGLSRYALAKALGCHVSTVSYWLEGRTSPNRRYKRRIAELYGYEEASLDEAELVQRRAPEAAPLEGEALEQWLDSRSRAELWALLDGCVRRLRGGESEK